MFNQKWSNISYKSLLLLAVAFLILNSMGCFKEATKVGVVYFNNFDDYDMKNINAFGFTNNNFGPLNSITIVDYNQSKVLGRFNNGKIELKLHKLPKHQAINVQFDLFLHDNWRNDVFVMEFDNQQKLVTGFSNDPNRQQSYPNWIGNGSPLNPPGANAFTTNIPGACIWVSKPNGSSMYKMERTEIHSDSTFTLACSDAGEFFNLNCDRSWSIDNLKITLINNQ
jgi:hypothetical protein